MITHTKGPWFAGDPGSVQEDYVKSERGNDVASVYPGDSDWESGAAIANTNLIAASPDLLEALKATLIYLNPTLRPAPEAIHKMVEAAIARAEGK